MFRLQDNVPEVYIERSRDFQLFCRLYDSVFGGVKYSIDSLQHAASTKECDSSLLELLKNKLGFFTTVEVDEEELRLVLQVFPIIIRYKGSLKALDYILTLYSRITNSADNFATYDRKLLIEEHRLVLRFVADIKGDKLLKELLQYVLPSGYTIELKRVAVFEPEDTVVVDDKIEYSNIPDNVASRIKVNPELGTNYVESYSDEYDSNPLPRTTSSMLANEEKSE